MRRNETPEQREIRIKRFEKVGKAHRWKKGQSGNPSGKSRSHYDLVKKAKAAGPRAFRTILEIIENPKAPLALRVKCATEVLDRGHGRPTNPLHLHAAVDIDHGQAHLEALMLVNAERAAERPRRNGQVIEGKSYHDVTSDDEAEDAAVD